jgi:hypothetical protein
MSKATTITITKPDSLVKSKEVTDGFLVAYIEDGKLKIFDAEFDMKAMAPMLMELLAKRILK